MSFPTIVANVYGLLSGGGGGLISGGPADFVPSFFAEVEKRTTAKKKNILSEQPWDSGYCK